MIAKLIRLNQKYQDIVVLETEERFLGIKEGKLGEPFTFSSARNCGSEEQAVVELKKLVSIYQKEGHRMANMETETIEQETFDKAKWHLEGDFPEELDPDQAYVHTGFYVGWLVMNDLISEELKEISKATITAFGNKEITSVQFYRDQMDGVFTSNDVNSLGFKFTQAYFDFEKGSYLADYENTRALDLPSLFHIADTWEHFHEISDVIDMRWKEFLSKRV